MNRRLTLYATAVVAGAIVSAGALYMRAPVVAPESVFPILLLSVLALVAELLSYVLPNSATGSIAFIPYLAAAVVVPSWIAVVGIVGVKTVVELVRRKSLFVSLFNVAQHALTLSIAIWVYVELGGTSMLFARNSTFFEASLAVGLPALVAFASSFGSNGVIACGYLALQKQQRISQLWRQLALPTLGMDVVVGPMVFIFAWLYAAHGAIAAAALWVPLLGLREVHRVNLELQRTNEELLQLMIKSIEARDLYTSGHSRRVQHYSTIIARAIGLGEREIERVGKAALLHDVGKIYEKYAPILRKPDKLSPDEWTTMQEHPIDGANLVETITGLKEIVGAVRHHHENWDGTGYPDGLAGELIPLASRIISFADTIDAMTSERPYRQPLTEAQVRAEIIRCRGQQFDPAIADRLVSSPMWRMLFQPPKRAATPTPVLAIVPGRRSRESA
jgi:putative nucleotidyltransferase with HDIG domain